MEHQPERPKGNALRRLTVLSSMISALIRSGRATLHSIGNHMEADTDMESRIKQAKRWLDSKWTDVEVHFIPYILPILRSVIRNGELVLAIDGSTTGKECMSLMVNLIWKKRAIPLCWVVRRSPKGHFPEEMHLSVLEQVHELFQKALLPNCRIVLLGDGEFNGNQVQQFCQQVQWNYVLRTAKDTLMSEEPDMLGVQRADSVLPQPGQSSFFLSDMYITRQGYGPVNIVYWHNRRYKEPLYLLTNLEAAPDAAYYYRKRYRIETFFADIKSRGFNMDRTRITEPERLCNLLIVVALAFILAILFEFDARKSGLIAKFCRKDRISDLSIFQIGLRGLRYYIRNRLPISFQFSKNFP